MNDTPLMASYAELRSLLENPELPEGIKSACLRLSQHQAKLFVTVPDDCIAPDESELPDSSGASDLYVRRLRLEPSSFLCELITALQASEWPRVASLLRKVNGA